MLGLLFFLFSLLFGYCLQLLQPWRLYLGERMALAAAFGISVSSGLLLLLSLAMPFAESIPLTGLLLFGFSSWTLVKFKKRPALRLESGRVRSGWLIGGILFGIVLIGLLGHDTLSSTGEGWNSMGGSWGDLALHMSLVSFFAEQAHLIWQLPIYYRWPLTYPFLIDLYSSVLLKGGLSWQLAFLLPSWSLALALIQLLFFLSYRFFKSLAAAWWGIFLFLTNGGWPAIFIAWNQARSDQVSLLAFLGNQTLDYTKISSAGLFYLNTLTDLLLPQRGLLLAVPLLLAAGLIWKLAWTEPRPSQSGIWLSGVLIGLLPLIQIHSFLIGFGLLLYLYLIILWKRRPGSGIWGAGLLLALILALPQLIWQLRATPVGFSHFQLGWSMPPGDNFFFFLLRNFGLELLLAVLLFIWQRRRFLFFLPFLLVFILLNIYLFQPNPDDNLKLMLYVHLAICLGGGALFVSWGKRGIVPALLLTFFLSGAGLLAIIREACESYPLFSPSDTAFAERFKQVVPATALVLTDDQHNHPVSTLTGRKIVLGYPGWLWSYGIDYLPVYKVVQKMYAGGEAGASLMKQYGVNYVVIGPPELQNDRANLADFKRRYLLVLQDGPWSVFKVGGY